MSTKHRRAAITTGLIGSVLISLVAYLWWIRAQDVSADLRPLGPATDFSYVLDDGQNVFTRSDTLRRITVLLQLRACVAPCANEAELAKTLLSWSEVALRPKDPEDTPPQPINFIVMQRSPHTLTATPEGWRSVTLDAKENFLLPPGNSNPQHDTLVVVDASGVYRAVLATNDPLVTEKMQRLLAKLTSSQFLYHYLAKQTLMWEKLRGR